jgi:hypothetical protein
LTLTLAATLAATLLNPLGWRGWPYLVTELTCEVNRRYIEEWQPASFSRQPWSAVNLTALLALLGAAGLVASGGVYPRRPARRQPIAGLPPWAWLLSCLPLAVMACRSVRHLPVLTIWAAPVLALLAQSAYEGMRRRRTGWLALTGLVALPALMPVALVLSNPEPAIQVGAWTLGSRHPCGAVAFLRANDLRGRVYNPLWWGSYLTWELHPGVLVGMDGRNVTLFSPEQVEANLSFYLGEEADLETPWRTRADFPLVPTDAAVLARLREDRRWAALLEDGQCVLFVRADEAHGEVLRRHRAGELVRPEGELPGRLR